MRYASVMEMSLPNSARYAAFIATRAVVASERSIWLGAHGIEESAEAGIIPLLCPPHAPPLRSPSGLPGVPVAKSPPAGGQAASGLAM
ncbi:hypothetical protein D3C74_454410 [compost metagenome]